VTRIIQDEQDFHRISMSEAVDLMRDALISVVSGTLVAPARHTLKVGNGGLTFTMGGESNNHQIAGFRVYDSVAPNATDHQHLTAVYDSVTGILKGLIVGRWVGDFRTGAIGGVAIDQLAHRDTKILSLIGTGKQARTQLQAALAVRTFETIRVFSRDAQRCRNFADELSQVTGVAIDPVDSSREAVSEADIIITATTSSTPVILSEWLKPGAHINLIGPKFSDACELEPSIFQRASLLATDSPDQALAFGDQLIVESLTDIPPLQDLATLVASDYSRPVRDRGISVFVSLGLAATEVILANAILQKQ
jgi:ornithine cyclodeaminase/alanine dehydrogenase-like protein (mu-crystallin family)